MNETKDPQESYNLIAMELEEEAECNDCRNTSYPTLIDCERCQRQKILGYFRGNK